MLWVGSASMGKLIFLIVGYEVTAGNVGRNAEELFRKVQACQFVHAHGDQVCPANWKPGAETLKPSLDLVGQL